MTWTERTKPIAVGDQVAMTAAFLRSTGQYTGDVPHAKGIVASLVPLGSITLAEIDWDTPDMPRRVAVANLCLIGSREYGA